MTKTTKVFNLIVLGLLIIISLLGTFYKHISFGLGLGDIFGYLILYIGTLTHLILTIVSRKKGKTRHIILALIFLAFTVLISLNATIWRGPEYSWNGSIFYLPCPTKIFIENNNEKKELLLQMCSMEYSSEFSGIWDGQKMILKSGQIKFPNELDKYITKPITKIEIEPSYSEILENDIFIKEFTFKKDTLKLNEFYTLSGKIIAIRNNNPVMNVTIK